jgi:hypothetical protein
MRGSSLNDLVLKAWMQQLRSGYFSAIAINFAQLCRAMVSFLGFLLNCFNG